jgi:hypothetical protein
MYICGVSTTATAYAEGRGTPSSQCEDEGLGLAGGVHPDANPSPVIAYPCTLYICFMHVDCLHLVRALAPRAG